MPKDASETDAWKHVARHQLVEAAGTSVLSTALKDKLGLSDQDVKDVTQAALLHDFYKRKEIEKGKATGFVSARMTQQRLKAKLF